MTGLVETDLGLLLEDGYGQVGISPERLARLGEPQVSAADDREGGVGSCVAPGLDQGTNTPLVANSVLLGVE